MTTSFIFMSSVDYWAGDIRTFTFYTNNIAQSKSPALTSISYKVVHYINDQRFNDCLYIMYMQIYSAMSYLSINGKKLMYKNMIDIKV